MRRNLKADKSLRKGFVMMFRVVGQCFDTPILDTCISVSTGLSHLKIILVSIQVMVVYSRL